MHLFPIFLPPEGRADAEHLQAQAPAPAPAGAVSRARGAPASAAVSESGVRPTFQVLFNLGKPQDVPLPLA